MSLTRYGRASFSSYILPLLLHTQLRAEDARSSRCGRIYINHHWPAAAAHTSGCIVYINNNFNICSRRETCCMTHTLTTHKHTHTHRGAHSASAQAFAVYCAHSLAAGASTRERELARYVLVKVRHGCAASTTAPMTGTPTEHCTRSMFTMHIYRVIFFPVPVFAMCSRIVARIRET